MSLCPGAKKTLVPVPLCPRTKVEEKILGQTHLSRDIPGQNELKNFKENDQIFCFKKLFSVLKCPFHVLECPFLLCPILPRIPSQILAVPASPQ